MLLWLVLSTVFQTSLFLIDWGFLLISQPFHLLRVTYMQALLFPWWFCCLSHSCSSLCDLPRLILDLHPGWYLWRLLAFLVLASWLSSPPVARILHQQDTVLNWSTSWLMCWWFGLSSSHWTDSSGSVGASLWPLQSCHFLVGSQGIWRWFERPSATLPSCGLTPPVVLIMPLIILVWVLLPNLNNMSVLLLYILVCLIRESVCCLISSMLRSDDDSCSTLEPVSLGRPWTRVGTQNLLQSNVVTVSFKLDPRVVFHCSIEPFKASNTGFEIFLNQQFLSYLLDKFLWALLHPQHQYFA